MGLRLCASGAPHPPIRCADGAGAGGVEAAGEGSAALALQEPGRGRGRRAKAQGAGALARRVGETHSHGAGEDAVVMYDCEELATITVRTHGAKQMSNRMLPIKSVIDA